MLAVFRGMLGVLRARCTCGRCTQGHVRYTQGYVILLIGTYLRVRDKRLRQETGTRDWDKRLRDKRLRDYETRGVEVRLFDISKFRTPEIDIRLDIRTELGSKYSMCRSIRWSNSFEVFDIRTIRYSKYSIYSIFDIRYSIFDSVRSNTSNIFEVFVYFSKYSIVFDHYSIEIELFFVF